MGKTQWICYMMLIFYRERGHGADEKHRWHSYFKKYYINDSDLLVRKSPCKDEIFQTSQGKVLRGLSSSLQTISRLHKRKLSSQDKTWSIYPERVWGFSKEALMGDLVLIRESTRFFGTGYTSSQAVKI